MKRWILRVVLAAVVVLLVLAAAVWATLRLRPSYAVYTWLSVLMPLTLVFGARPLMSTPRYYLVVFPMIWALARFAERWRAHDLVVIVSAGSMGLLGLLFATGQPIF